MVARQQLERQQGGAAARRALVVEASSEQLELLAEPKLADRTVGDGPLPVVRAARRGLDVVGPLRAQIGEAALVAGLRELVGLRSCLREGHTEASERGAGPT